MFSVYETETGKLVNVCEPEELSKFVLETVKYSSPPFIPLFAGTVLKEE